MNSFDLASKYNLRHPLDSNKSADSFSLASKYGLAHPLDPTFSGSDSFSSNPELNDQMKSLDTNITNYTTRLNSIGEQTPEPKQPTNLLLKALSYLDRPRAALWNGIHDALYENKDFSQGAWEGLTGKDDYTGSQLMGDLGVKNGIAKGVGGFLADVLGDPLNLVTFGAGSAAKGALTGAARLGEEGASMLAKAALKDVTQQGAEDLGKLALKMTGEEATKDALEKATKEAMVGQFDNALSKYGLSMNHPDMYNSIDDVMSHARSQLSDSFSKSANLAADNARGISIGTKNHNISLVSGETMQNLGAKLQDVPIIGKGLKTVGEIGSKIFNPKYIHGLDKVEQDVAYNIKRDAQGAKNLADNTITDRFTDYAKTLGELGPAEAAKQDSLIRRVIEGADDISKVRPELHNMVNEMKNDFMKWGAKEEDIGALKNMFDENYFPRIKNWDNAEKVVKGGLTEKLKIVNPSGFQRKYNMQTAELANTVMKFKTSSDVAKEEFGNTITSMLTKANNEELKPLIDRLSKNPTNENIVSEAINTGLKSNVFTEKQILDLANGTKNGVNTLDGVGHFFETSAVKGWISRGLRHNQIIADNDFLRGTLNAFGNKIDNIQDAYKAAEKGMTVVIPKSSLDLFRVSLGQDIKLKQGLKESAKEASANQAFGDGIEVTNMSDELKSVVKTLISDTPEAFKRVTPEQLEVIQKYGGTALFGRHNIVEAYAVPNGVADALKSSVARQTDAGKEALGDVIDNFYRLWKPTVTGLRPDYHIRNFMGNTLNNMLNVGFKALDPTIQKDAVRLMGHAEGDVMLGGEKVSMQEIRDAMTQTHATTNIQANEFENLKKTLNSEFKGSTNGVVKEAAKHPFQTMANVGGTAGKVVETQGRIVNFLANVQDALEKGLNRQEAYRYAGQQVNKYLFDYSELTKVEKDVFRRIMPFYTWMRKNVPLQLENFLNNPSFYSKFYQAKHEMEQANGVDSSNMPAWMQGDLPIPIGSPDANGKVPYLDVSPPQADLARANDPLKSLMTMLTPLLKVPIETYMNRSMLTGAPIYANDYEKNQKILENVLGQFGIARDIGNAKAAITGTDNNNKTVSNVDLPGPMSSGLLKNYDPAYGAKDTMYQYNRDLGNLIQYLQDSGTFVPGSTKDAKEYAQLTDAEKQQFIANQADKGSQQKFKSRNEMLSDALKALGMSSNPREKAINQAKKRFSNTAAVVDYKNGGL